MIVQPARPGRHLCGIDLVRFAAALLVVFFHLTWQEEATAIVAWYGWIGVQVFFVISGVVIARSATSTTPLRFLRSRVLRLYPCAWICAIIGVAVLASVHRPEADLGMRFLRSFLLSPIGPFLVSAYWTLPIELAFYLVILLVLIMKSPVRLETVAVILCWISAGYNLAYALQVHGVFGRPSLEFGYDWKNLTLLRHGIYFGLGILIWLWSERRLEGGGRVAVVVALAAAALEIGCRSTELLPLLPAPLDVALARVLPVAIWLVFVCLIACSARFESEGPLLPSVVRSSARAAGLVTYPLYLLHEHFGLAIRNVLVRLHMPLLASVCIAVAASTMLAFVIARWGEPLVRRSLSRALGGWIATPPPRPGVVVRS